MIDSSGSLSSSGAAGAAAKKKNRSGNNDDEGGVENNETRSLSPSSLPLHHDANDDDTSEGTNTTDKEGKNSESFHQFLDYINFSDGNTTNNNTTNGDNNIKAENNSSGGGGEGEPSKQQRPQMMKRKSSSSYYESRRSSNDSTVRTSNLNLLTRPKETTSSVRTLDTSLKSSEHNDYTLDESAKSVFDEMETYTLGEAAGGDDIKSSRKQPPPPQQQSLKLKSRLQRQKEERTTNQRVGDEEARSSLRLSEVFDEKEGGDGTTTTSTNNTTVSSKRAHTNSSPSSNTNNVIDNSFGNSLSNTTTSSSHLNASDSSSLCLDISWGSNLFDRATVMSSLEEVMKANPHMKLDTGESTSDRERSGGSSGGFASSSGGGGSNNSNSFGKKSGGGSRNTSSKNLAAMAPIAISHDNDGDSTTPPTFRTRRRTTTDSGATGDGSVVSGSGGGGGGGSRRPSAEGRLLRNNLPLLSSPKDDEDDDMGPIVHVDGGGDRGSEVFPKTLAYKERSIRRLSDNQSVGSGILGTNFTSVGSGWRSRRRPSTDTMSSLGSAAVVTHHAVPPPPPPPPAETSSRVRRSVEISDSSHDLLRGSKHEQGSKSSRSRFSQFSSKTNSSVGVDDMDISVENFSQHVPTPGNATGEENDGDDRELVAAVGGTAYLKATKKVWAMRIIVIATFVVVSIIVTVLIYTFFRNLESNTLTNEFAMLAVSLTRNVIELMERKAFSLNVLATNYEGILGLQTNFTVPPGNHAPSVMLSDEARATCGDSITSNNEWRTHWPYVTLPGYESYSKSMLTVTEDRAVFFAPVVPDANVSAWEDYARKEALPSAEGAVAGGIRTPSGDIVEYEVKDVNHRFIQQIRTAEEGHLHQDTNAGMSMNESTTFMEEDGGSLPVRVPIWQLSSTKLNEDGLMWDVYKHPPYTEALDRILQTQSSSSATKLIPCSDLLIPFHLTNPPSTKMRNDVVMEYTDGSTTGEDDVVDHEAHSHHKTTENGAQDQSFSEGVCSAIFSPVHSSSAHGVHNSAHVTGAVASLFSWEDLLSSSAYPVRRSTGHGSITADIFVVVTSKLSEGFPNGYPSGPATYYVTEHGAVFRGMGRHIEQKHADMMLKYDFKLPFCDVVYTFEVYPTDLLCNSYGVSNTPTFLALIACCFVVLSTLVFFIYDYFVNYRQKVIIQQAARSTRIVHSLYPAFVRDNLFQNERKPSVTASADEVEDTSLSAANEPNKRKLKLKVSDLVDTPANQLKRFLSHPIPSKNYDLNMVSELDVMDPIAEVFENTTVMIADIEGFTAWCSEREPTQVFRLLETVYRAFDLEGSKAGVFKVETVGDSYVAVTGLPDAREDHAIMIAKYSIKCLLKFNVLAKRLEPHLGPGTASLGMRFGLHSGPVTAGVLRGEKSRFQLFGDTINVASRMESTGEKNMIQVSQDTADLLTSAGKGHWLVPRDNPVSAKGKGLVQTYWLQPNKRRPSMNTASMRLSVDGSNDGYGMASGERGEEIEVHRALSRSWKNINIENGVSIAKERLIRWNAAILESFLLKIVEQRNVKDGGDDPVSPLPEVNDFTPSEKDKILSFAEILCEKVMFPDDSYSEEYPVVLVGTSINPKARAQLLEYVAIIASMYRDVPFHNFDHASHVTMSANKLLNRVCTAFVSEEEDFASVAARTFGISADPLAQFVIVFSSLVHDVDHQGVPNAQLVKEHDPLCEKYDNRSVAEKRSIAIAWDILMEDRFVDLQGAIFTNSREMMRFRQLLMNTVLATDIADKERSAAGKIRWQKAFHPSNPDVLDDTNEKQENIRSLKATLVFEQIMQASDVSHTMQHWHTFKKWNKRLYSELSKAYREGRGATDPRENWYGGEIGFFDFYIIPLAKKLRECGVFGSAASEYLDYAVENRRRWEEEGKEIATKMVSDYDALHLRDEVLDEEDSIDLQREEENNDEREDFEQSGLSSIMSYNEQGNQREEDDDEEVSALDSTTYSGRETPLDVSSENGDEIV